MAIVVLFVPFLLFKEFRLLCFDEGFAVVQGWPVKWLDALLLGLLTLIVVAGLQAVGLILIIAFWSFRLPLLVFGRSDLIIC